MKIGNGNKPDQNTSNYLTNSLTNMKNHFICICIIALLGCNNAKPQSDKIPLEDIQNIFSEMKANGVYTDKTLLWGYFFISDAKDKFNQITEELKKQNFEFVEIYQSEDRNYWLHLERKEIHSPQTLYTLDKKLYQVAEKYNVTYDGFDVGNINKGQPLERDTYTVPEEFKGADYLKDHFPYLLFLNTAFDRFPHKEEFCHFAKVTTSFKKDGKTLLPTREELDELNQFEMVFESYLKEHKVKNYYVFRETHRGNRIFYFVTNDAKTIAETIAQLKKSNRLREFDVDILTDKDWSLYEKLRETIPNEQE